MRILLVEQDPKIAEQLNATFTAEQFALDWHRTGESATKSIAAVPTDCILLSLTIPNHDGLGVLRQIRAEGHRLPIILLTGPEDVGLRIEGLNSGADDCVCKPFFPAELVARIRALIRRCGEAPLPRLQVGDLILDPASRQARRGERVIDLTQREYQLLEFLMRSDGKVCPRSTIIERVWNYQFDPGTNIVDVYIRKLRGKVEGEGDTKLFHCIKGVGYTLRA